MRNATCWEEIIRWLQHHVRDECLLACVCLYVFVSKCDSKFRNNWVHPGINHTDADVDKVICLPVNCVWNPTVVAQAWHTSFFKASSPFVEQGSDNKSVTTQRLSFFCVFRAEMWTTETKKRRKKKGIFLSDNQRRGDKEHCVPLLVAAWFLCKAEFCLAAELSSTDAVILIINTHELEVCPWLLCSFCCCAVESEAVGAHTEH